VLSDGGQSGLGELEGVEVDMVDGQVPRELQCSLLECLEFQWYAFCNGEELNVGGLAVFSFITKYSRMPWISSKINGSFFQVK
jgi:hypothetical protein